MKHIVRILSFFAKEINSVRRQPLLLGGLILGPFLILSMFGVGYTGERPTLRTALVVPPGQKDSELVQNLRENMGATFQVSDEHIYEDQAPAMTALRQNQVDIVEVFPPDMTDVYTTGKQINIDITYNEIDPLLRDWIEYLSYTQINELNKELLRIFVGQTQERVGTLKEYLNQSREQLQSVRNRIDSGDREQARATVQQLREGTTLQLLALAMVPDVSSENSDSASNLQRIKQLLDDVDRDLAEGGALDQQEQRLSEIDQQLAAMQAVADRVRTLDPLVIVSPLRSKTHNIVPISSFSNNPGIAYVQFYTPAVVALLLQHMMVTLAALSLIRERMLGTLEMFRVAPISAEQVLTGKYLGYTLFGLLIMLALMPLLVFGLGIPFPLNQLGNFIVIVLLLTTASLGWGFVISALVRSDSQAVQFSMLLLLMSVFFSGFFIPLKSFIPSIRTFAKILPVTHGLQSLQQLLLLNQAPTTATYLWLLGIALVSFVLSWYMFRRQFQRR